VSQEQETLWMIKGVIGELPVERLQKVTESYVKIKTIMSEYGDEGEIAIALIGAELAAKA
jgi:hypothetical protein